MRRRVRLVAVPEVDVDRLARSADPRREGVVGRLPPAEVAERRGVVEIVDADGVRLGEPRLDPVPRRMLEVEGEPEAGSSEPSSSSIRPSSRAFLSETRTGPRRSPSARIRSPKTSRLRAWLPGSFGANSKPSGACSAQRWNCSSAGSR